MKKKLLFLFALGCAFTAKADNLKQQDSLAINVKVSDYNITHLSCRQAE